MTRETVSPPKYVVNKFNGTSSRFADSTMPPDSDGAIGPYHYVEFLNGVFTVYDKFSHQQLAQITDKEFWYRAGIQQPIGLVDPRIIYVPNAGKYGRGQWLAVQLYMGNKVYLACTDPNIASPSPLPGSWKAAEFDLPGNDFTQVGFDGTGIYLTVQKSMGSTPRWSQFVFMPQVTALAFPPQFGPGSGMKIFEPLDPAKYGTGLYPVADTTGGAWKFATFICANYVTLRHLTYVKMLVEQREIVSHANIEVEPFGFIPFTRVKQPAGSAADKVTFYVSDIAAAPQSDGFNVWVTHTIKKLNECLAVRWYRLAIDPVTRDLILANWGELSDPRGHYDYYNSSIASFGKDDYTVVCFSRSGDSTTPSDPNDPNCGNIGTYAAIIREDGSNPPQTTIVPIQAGLANNFQPRPEQDFARWGDFSTIWRDMTDYNGRNMWMINQYVSKGGSSSEWCEVIAILHIDPPA